MKKRKEKEELFFEGIQENIFGSEYSTAFGRPCLNIQGKPFCILDDDVLVCKLSPFRARHILNIDRSGYFDPDGDGNFHREWIAIPFRYFHSIWYYMARDAAIHVGGNDNLYF